MGIIRASRMPLTGRLRLAAKLGYLHSQVTPMTISMGMRQIRPKVIHPEKFGKSNREMKPRETAMMMAVDAGPAAGWFMPRYRTPADVDLGHGGARYARTRG